jgi:hypothetical protein
MLTLWRFKQVVLSALIHLQPIIFISKLISFGFLYLFSEPRGSWLDRWRWDGNDTSRYILDK